MSETEAIGLATIVKVISIKAIENCDNIELTTVLGWNIVTKKNEFTVGDLGIYFCIDSILDKNNENMKFLEGKPLKTRKIRGAISQGLLVPLVWLKDFNIDPTIVGEDDDVTQFLNVKKYIHPEEQNLYHQNNKGGTKTMPEGMLIFPQHIPKTDEPRGQNMKKTLSDFNGRDIVITQKFDGTSTTYINDRGNFVICGRNYIISEDVGKVTNHYFEIAKRYNLKEKMQKLDKNIAIQGELCGPKMNNNRLKMDDIDYFVFNMYDIDNRLYLKHEDVVSISSELGLKMVTELYNGVFKNEYLEIDNLLKLADQQKYLSGTPCEGIVVKTNDNKGGRISFKIISNEYLLKYKL